MQTNDAVAPGEIEARPGAFVLAALLVPFLANDAANILISRPVPWLTCDYAVRLTVLALFGAFAARRVIPRGTLQKPEIGPAATAGAFIATTLIGLVIVVGPGRHLLFLWPGTQVATIPSVTDPLWRAFDLSAGLALVALSEELVFRGVVLRTFLREFGSPAIALLISSVLFGFAHWSLGAGAIAQTSLAGLVLGLCTLKCRSIWPAVAAHYLIDFAAFW